MSTASPVSPASPGASSSTQSIAPPYAAAVTPSGPEWRSQLTREGRIPLARPVVQIGRLEGNDIIVNDLMASRHHAAIRWTPQGYEIEDLGSANGTYVQGQRISGRVLLAPGQTIRIGSCELSFNVLHMPGHADAAGAQSGAPTVQPGGGAQAPSTSTAGNAQTLVRQPIPPLPVSPAPPVVQAGAPAWSPLGHGQPFVDGGVAALSPALAHPYYTQAAQHRENGLVRLFRTEWSKRYWRIFLLGVIAYIVVAQVLNATANLHLVPLVLLLASALVPVVFVMFLWEQNALVDMPLGVVGITFMLGGVLGLTIAAVLEPVLLPQTGSGTITLQVAILIGLCEETAKVVCVLWCLRDTRLRSELDGLILGAAAGMGFAALETAGYGFAAFLRAFVNELGSSNSTLLAIEAGSRQMNYQLVIRMALAIFGHGVWTAIVAAAIWRERRQSTFRLTSGVLMAFAIAVVLHALWDWSPIVNLLPYNTDPTTALVVVFGWFLFVGALGIFFLRFFLRESIQRAKLGPYAPPPPPLLRAIIDDTLHPFRNRQPQPAYPYATYPYAAQQAQSMQPLAQVFAPPQAGPSPKLGYPQSGAASGYQRQYPSASQPPPNPRLPGR